jgi:hypothetical protein
MPTVIFMVTFLALRVAVPMQPYETVSLLSTYRKKTEAHLVLLFFYFLNVCGLSFLRALEATVKKTLRWSVFRESVYARLPLTHAP